MIQGFTRRFSPLELLTAEEVEAVHRGALYVLQMSGMRIEHEMALKLCAHRGCSVDFDKRRVRFPAGLVEESLRQCPSSFPLKARDRGRDLMIGGDTVYFMQGMGMRYLDLTTWETRPATSDEHRDAMIVADALENVHLADGVFFYKELPSLRTPSPSPHVLELMAHAYRIAKDESYLRIATRQFAVLVERPPARTSGPKVLDESGAVIHGSGDARSFAASYTSTLLYASQATPLGLLDWYEYPA